MTPRLVRPLLVAVAAVLLTAGCAGGDGGPVAEVAAAEGGAAAGDLRVERWHGVQVSVPADWALGTAPLTGPRRFTVCGGEPSRPYVGRPIAETDVCGTTDADAVPGTTSVWLGVDLEPGVVELGEGWTRETIAAEGTTVTVTARDSALRAAVLDSAEPVTRCRASLDRAPTARRDVTIEGVGDLVGASICVYQRSSGRFDLQHGSRLRARAVAGVERVADRTRVRRAPCTRAPDELVVVTATFADPYDGSAEPEPVLTHRFVHAMGTCSQLVTARYHRAGQVERRLTEAAVRPWVDPRYRHLLTGPHTDWAYRYFIGVQG